MSETNNNFSELKRLLKLKQHEVPPPGYFNRFSGDVISRIRAGESGGTQTILEQYGSGSVLTHLLQIFHAKPGIIGGFATSLCLLLLIGVVLADRPDGTSVADETIVAPTVPGDSSSMIAQTGLLPPSDSGITISSNSPIHSLQAMPGMFGSQQNPLFQTVGFMQPAQ